MGFLKNIFNNKSNKPTPTGDPKFDFITQFIGSDDFDVDSKGVINISNDIYSVVNDIATTISNQPINSTNQYMQDLLQNKPNPYESGYNLECDVLLNLLIYGDAFCLLTTDQKTNLINRIDLLPNPCVTIQINGNGSSYLYEPTGQTFNEDQVLHFRMPSIDTYGSGLSPLLSLKPILRLARDSTKTLRNYYRNGLFSKAIIDVKDTMSNKNKRKLKEQFRQNMGADNVGGSIIQDDHVIKSIKPYSTSNGNSEIIKDTKAINDQIGKAVCSAYGVPSSLLVTNPHANTSDEMSRFHSDIRKYINILTSELNRKLSGQFTIGDYINVNTPSDVASLAKSGAISPAQAQTLLGLPLDNDFNNKQINNK